MHPLMEELHAIGMRHGLEKVGVCSAEPFGQALDELRRRRQEGLAADMQFTFRNPERSTDPSRSLPGARSLVVGALSTRRRQGSTGGAPHRTARIAEYVWEPHYEVLRRALEEMSVRLRADGHRSRVLVDDNALVDRAAAYRAGIGWYGKNSNLLIRGRGSRIVLGSVLTDAELGGSPEPEPDGCGPCRRCIDNCPTDAIIDDGVVDARRCLAWLVQADGVFPRELRVALGDRIYGCDDCQTTCPPNVTADRLDPPPATSGRSTVDLVTLLSRSDDELLEEHGAWYIPRRQPRYLRRNALIALANTATTVTPPVRAAVDEMCRSADPVERSHAVWAAHRLGLEDLVDAAAADTDPLVRAELDAIRGAP